WQGLYAAHQPVGEILAKAQLFNDLSVIIATLRMRRGRVVRTGGLVAKKEVPPMYRIGFLLGLFVLLPGLAKGQNKAAKIDEVALRTKLLAATYIEAKLAEV